VLNLPAANQRPQLIASEAGLRDLGGAEERTESGSPESERWTSRIGVAPRNVGIIRVHANNMSQKLPCVNTKRRHDIS
jgi:hypothetical protein